LPAFYLVQDMSGYIIYFQAEMNAPLQTCLLIQTIFLIALLQVSRIQER